MEGYRSDLRELNELNFARFDAKLEQRIVETNARIDRLGAELNAKIEVGLAQLRGEIHKSAREQLVFMFGAWATLLIAILSMHWLR